MINNHQTTTRRGFSLIEVVAATAIMGMIALIAVSSVRLSSIGNYGAEVDVRTFASTLHQARRATISTGENHVVVLTRQGRRAVSFRLHRRRSGRLTPVSDPVVFGREVYVTGSSQNPEFSFEGDAVRSLTYDVAGPNRRWRLSVSQAGGGITVKKL